MESTLFIKFMEFGKLSFRTFGCFSGIFLQKGESLMLVPWKSSNISIVFTLLT